MELYAVKLCQLVEHAFALRQSGKIAYQNKVADGTVEGSKHGRYADGLQNGVDNAEGNVVGRHIVAHFPKQRGRCVHRQIGQLPVGDVTDLQVYVSFVAAFRHFYDLMDVAGVEGQFCQSDKRTASQPDTADVADAFLVDLYERGACPHADHDVAFQQGGFAGTEPVGRKLVDMGGRNAVDGGFDVGAAHTGNPYVLNVGKLQSVVVQKLSECPEERRDRIGGLDENRGDDFAVGVDAHNLCRASSGVNADD